MQRVDFGMHHERVLVGLELVVAQDLVRIGIQQIVRQQLLFAGVRHRLVVETSRSAIVARADHATVGTHQHRPHLGILVFRKARLRTHHLGIDFVTKLAARLRIVHVG